MGFNTAKYRYQICNKTYLGTLINVTFIITKFVSIIEQFVSLSMCTFRKAAS